MKTNYVKKYKIKSRMLRKNAKYFNIVLYNYIRILVTIKHVD